MKTRKTKRDDLFLRTGAKPADFVFDAEVAQVFDDMLVRSVPFYLEQQSMICEIGRRFWIPETNIYDLGCSTANTLINLAQVVPRAQLVGYDNSLPMLEQARFKVRQRGLGDRIELQLGDLNQNCSSLCLQNAGVVTLCWTLQFIRPLHRDSLIHWIYNALVENGVLIVAEKIVVDNSLVNRFFIDRYYQFKKGNYYSYKEIMRKREALENVLVPYKIDENMEMFRRNGFEIVESFFQWYNFAGFLCIKKPSHRRTDGAPANELSLDSRSG